MTYATLPERARPDVRLYCDQCGEFFSADRGDYFLRDQGCSPRCMGCNSLLRLVQKVVVLKPIGIKEAEDAR